MKKNKVIQKIFKLFLVCLMFLGALFQNSNLSFADGAGVDRAKTKITKLEIKKVNGESLPDNFTYDYWEKYRLDMDWDASEYGNQLKAGDHFTVTLPREFNFPKDSAAVDFPLYAPDGRTVIANAHVDSNGEAGGGTVKVTFTDYVENKDNIRGNMFLQAGFARDNVNAGGSNLITVDIGGVKTSKNIKIGTKGTVGKETLAKWGEKVENDESAVKWFLRINHKKGNFKNVTISDSLFVNSGNLPPEIHYIEDSFVLYEIEFDESGSTKQILRTYDYAEIKDFITLSDNNTKFTFDFGKKFGDTAGKQYLFRYMSTYIPQLVLRNEAVFHSAEENTSKQASYKSAQSGGGGQGDLIQKIKIFKVDENNNKIKLPNAEFLITKVKDGSTFTLTTDAQGEAVSEKLEPGKYKIKETRAPKGYSLDGTEKEVTVAEGEPLFWTVKNAKEKVNIEGTKAWKDENNQDGKRPDKIKVILNKTVDGVTTKVAEKEVTKDNWSYKFADLPKYEDDKEITYSIDEEEVTGYTKTIDGYNLTNSYTPEVVNIQGTKTWDDANNQDGKRPEKITVILNKTVDSVTTKVAEKEVTKDNWSYEFNNLPKYENGKEIAYSIDEEAVAGYEKEVTGYNLKNSHTPEVVNIQGTKTWDDANNQDGKRPDKIKVILNKIVDGVTTKVAEKEVTKDNWNYEFNNLPKYKNGKKITYSIDEEAVPGYEKEVTGYNLKNSHTPEVVNVQGTKTWDDANNKYGKRPEKITVILNKTVDGKTSKIIEATVTKDDNWSYSFKNLPKYENGKLITYSIDEEAVAGYKKTIDGYNLKNTYIPPKPKLPNTGSTSTELGGLGFLAALTGLVLARRKNKTN